MTTVVNKSNISFRDNCHLNYKLDPICHFDQIFKILLLCIKPFEFVQLKLAKKFQ